MGEFFWSSIAKGRIEVSKEGGGGGESSSYVHNTLGNST